MKNSASPFMDKQIMDLSNPHAVTDGQENSFIDFLNRPSEKKGDILASYDFMPIRQALGSTTTAVADSDTGDVDTARRKWNSFDTKSDAPSIRSYNALDADQSAKFSSPNSDAALNVVLVSEIEKIMKKNMENLTHSIDTMSARITQLETRTRHLENSIDDLKDSVHNNHGSNDGRMRLLENILNEVRTGVGFIKDKQEIMEAQLQITKLQAPPVKKDESSDTALADPTQRPSGNQQFSSFPPAQPPQPLAPPPQNQNLQPPFQPPPQSQNLQPTFQPPARESYIPPSNQPAEIPAQQYQVPAPPPQPVQFPQQYQSPSPLPQYPQQAPPSQPPQAMPSHPPPPPPFSAANPSMAMAPFSQHPEEAAPYAPPQTYPPTMNPPSSHPPPQQSYGPGPTPNPNAYFSVPTRPGPGFHGTYGPPGGTGEPYPNPYNNPQSQYGSSYMKPQQHPSAHPQLPTARILPEALPTAAPIGSSSSRPGSSGNNIPTEDVVNRVVNMGFPRDQVRATVRKLSEEGHAIDLNIVLDKLMNGSEGQPQRGWYGR